MALSQTPQARHNRTPAGRLQVHAAQRRYRLSGLADQTRAEKRRRIKERLAAIKLARGCADCGYNVRAVALDFDHVRGEKVCDLARAVDMAWGRIEAEIAKCEVVCANCHRIRTEDRRGG